MALPTADDRIRTLLAVMPRLLRAERPPAAALRDIADLTRSLFDARYAAATLLEQDGTFGAMSFSGIPEPASGRLGSDADGRRLFATLLGESPTLRVEDVSTGAGLDLPRAHPEFSSFLGVQLRADNRVVGLLYLCDRADGSRFSADDEQLLQTVGALAGAALANAQLLRDALHARRWMRAAAGITQELFSGERDRPLELVARRVHELAEADFVVIALLEDGALHVRHATAAHLDPELVGQRIELDDTTLVKRAVEDGRGLVVSSLAPEARDFLQKLSGVEIGPAMLLPLRGGDGVLGVMFLGREVDSWLFTETDVEIAGSFANHAAVTLELASAREVSEHLHLLEERNRIGRDLHDHVVQRLYATGMSLQMVIAKVDGPPRERISGAITTLDDTIRQIRNTIMSLNSAEEQDATLETLIEDIVREAAPLLGFSPLVALEAPTNELQGPLAADLAACVREGISNAVRHAKADHVEIHAALDPTALVLTLRDDGVGIRSQRRSGLQNMAARVKPYGGQLDVISPPDGGTELSWRVPRPRVPLPRTPHGDT